MHREIKYEKNQKIYIFSYKIHFLQVKIAQKQYFMIENYQKVIGVHGNGT